MECPICCEEEKEIKHMECCNQDLCISCYVKIDRCPFCQTLFNPDQPNQPEENDQHTIDVHTIPANHQRYIKTIYTLYYFTQPFLFLYYSYHIYNNNLQEKPLQLVPLIDTISCFLTMTYQYWLSIKVLSVIYDFQLLHHLYFIVANLMILMVVLTILYEYTRFLYQVSVIFVTLYYSLKYTLTIYG